MLQVKINTPLQPVFVFIISYDAETVHLTLNNTRKGHILTSYFTFDRNTPKFNEIIYFVALFPVIYGNENVRSYVI